MNIEFLSCTFFLSLSANLVNISPKHITCLALELCCSEILVLLQKHNKVLVHRPLNYG